MVFDPFLGSGTTLAAAHVLDRVGYGVEISPAYCDVILRRMMSLTGETPKLEEAQQALTEVAAERGVALEDCATPRALDSRAIKHRGVAPYYGSKRKAAVQ